MIPSRPLNIGEMFAQTFSIFGRTFTRYVVLFLLFFVPGALLLTYGAVELSKEYVAAAEHQAGFNDRDLLNFRNHMRETFARENPAFRQQMEDLRESDTSHAMAGADSASRAIAPRNFSARAFFVSHIDSFSSSLALLILGGFLLLIGAIVLSTTVTDLACQSFEERPLNLRHTLLQSLTRHLWRLLALYAVYIAFSIVQNMIGNVLLNVSPGLGGIFNAILLFIEIYLMARLVFTVPALVSEELGPIAAVKRSWNLTKGPGATSWARVFGILLLLGFFLFGVWMVLLIGSSFFIGGAAIIWWTDFLKAASVTIPSFLSGFVSFLEAMALFLSIPVLLLFPFVPIFTTVFYYDFRTRVDGPLDYGEDHYTNDALPPPVLWQP